MAESVDALVSNTSGVIRAGSTPALGTESESSSEGSDFCYVSAQIFNVTLMGASYNN